MLHPTDPAALTKLLASTLDLPEQQIGPEDNLIELGLDSITMMRLAGSWRKAGLRIAFGDLIADPRVAAWQVLLAAAEAPAPGAAPVLAEIDESAPFPLALMQHAYWVGRQPGQRLGDVAAHFYHEFDGDGVDPERLEPAVRQVIERHGMLRVRIGDDGTQHLSPSRWPGLTVHRDPDLTVLRERLSHRAMDIGAGEVFDVQLSLLPDGRTRVHVNLDMVAADALSLRVLLADLATAYAGQPLPPLAYSFPRYLADRSAEPTAADLAYWRDRLPELPGAPRLPTTGGGTPVVQRRHRWLAPDEVRALAHNAQRHGLTPAMALAAVFAETLTAWSAEPRFLLNLPLFDREPLHPDVDALVGDFTSSVLLEWDGSQPGSFAERAARLQQRFHADVAHTAHSGVDVLRDLSRLHGEQVLAPVVYTSALGLGELFSHQVRDTFGDSAWIISQGPQVWLDAQVTELNDGLLVNWDIREDAFTPGVPEAMFTAYCGLLDRLLTTADTWTTEVRPLLPAAQTEVRDRVNATDVSRRPQALHEQFFTQAKETPDAPALLCDQEVLTYGELAAAALRVAGHLRAQGADGLVAVSLPKGPEQVVAVLGVLAAGAAYLPLAVDAPPVRRERILRAAGVTHLIDSIEVDAEPLSEPVFADGLAYVIFTSGSTGEPKGVEITHAAAVNTVADLNARFEIGATDRTLALSALEFDLSVYDIFGPLSVGGAVVCVREHGHRDASAWVRELLRHNATVLNCVPALLDMVLTAADTPLPLRTVLLGGDRVTVDLPARLTTLAPGAHFAGLGGTTETAIHSTVCEVTAVDPQWTSVPYGTPLDNVRCRVVDALGRDCPDWVPGELWIGGAGVALGYRNDPVRSADRFVEHNGLRWYRTGDLARYRDGGVLEFLGRADHQVKLRGHRVELGEVEAALTEHPSVSAAVATVLDRRVLAAAVTGAVDETELLAFITERLPAAMVPGVLLTLPAFPLTPNGKVNRPALRALLEERDAGSAQVITLPSTKTEMLLANIWQELLGVPAVGREHDFFTLGGDSLLATRLIGKLRAAGLAGAALSDLFANPVLAAFATTLTTVTNGPTQQELIADPDHQHDPFAPTDVQRAYWLGRSREFTLGGVGCHFYREYDVADLDLTRLEAAVNQLIARHGMLRAVFDERGDQRVLPEVPHFTVEVAENPEQLREALSHHVFDPTEWPLFRIAVAPNGTSTRLAIGIDNLIADALSVLIVYTELAALHDHPGTTLPPVELSFRDYVRSLPAEPAPASSAYWSTRLDTLPPGPALPLAIDPAEITRPRFTRRATVLDPVRWQRVLHLAREHGSTPSSVLLTAFAEVLSAFSARPDLTLNLTLFDRREVHPQVARVLGDFTSLLLVGYQPQPGEVWLDRVRAVQADLWRALDHREVSAIQVLRERSRRTGEAEVTMPVVFTSALGLPTAAPAGAGLLANPVWGVSQTPQVWLDHQVVERHGPDGVAVELNWDAVEDLFPAGLLDAMFAAYLRLVDWLCAEDWTSAVPSALPAAQRETRAEVNATAEPQQETLLHNGFFTQAARHPDAIALYAGPDRVTYGELADRALRVAGLLTEHHLAPGEPVVLHLPKGVDQIVAVLGVHAAGGAYVPVGVDQPAVRRNRIIATSGARLTLTDDLARGLPGTVLTISDAHTPAAELSTVDSDTLAYVIFTSGSTGEPKGVEITHRAAVNTVEDINTRFGITAADRVLAVSALDFDLSVYDIFGLLAAGGALVLVGEEERRDARRWAELVREHGVTVWNTVPTLLDMLLVVAENGPPPETLRLALVSGDWVGLDLPGRLAATAPAALLVALGGATEASIWSNALEVREVDSAWRSVPYGYPLRNQRYRVVDAFGRDCPDWVPGELWIGGTGVALGYRGAPELTARSFVDTPDGRWYRTGDLGRYQPGGLLEFLGRTDQQIKVRGHRVELGEIEAVLSQHEAVERAVVVQVRGRLSAAIVPNGKIAERILLDWAAARLPGHMVPDSVTEFPEFPLSANGKVDRAAIAARSGTRADTAHTPSGPVETAIAELWTRVLDVPQIGRQDSFFALGGDSVRAIRFIELARQELRRDIPLARFFAAPLLHLVAAAAVPAGAAEVEEGEI
ncbi:MULTISPECIES: non-ribosomal peptide synthetase [unclassified Crossiella]|uniref:non-ribosomal peptide synthetase n=1 Tax=unclassified Crossiella TaxID=2620835 RepID=UPI0020000E0B|nr:MULTISPECIES: non-ribosomal peptide synthetase [unclassified Crossiella]MCK2244644.1 amino acid adenylation domain-containing protein [Crossiella sp. S99.2]MCK2258369.1 amino acid adenylation domain-containing protein [Crossiella sp. S99.1]